MVMKRKKKGARSNASSLRGALAARGRGVGAATRSSARPAATAVLSGSLTSSEEQQEETNDEANEIPGEETTRLPGRNERNRVHNGLLSMRRNAIFDINQGPRNNSRQHESREYIRLAK